jgi:hypothetical protein
MKKPIGPEHFSKIRLPVVEKFVEDITDHLVKKDAEDVITDGPEENGVWYVEAILPVKIKLIDKERESVSMIFKAQGWDTVKIKYSDENGERGGIVEVRLYKSV